MTEAERLGDVVADLDAQRFVGRAAALDLVARARAGASPTRIVHLHGPGGVGKSALVRAIGRAAAADGHAVVRLDGRLIGMSPDALDTAFGPAEADGAVVLIDEVDHLAPLRFELRELVRTRLPASAVVVLAGRATPDREWFDDGLEQVSTSMALRPLSTDESREMLARHGMSSEAEVAQLVQWSAGYPLALTVAAAVQTAASDEELTVRSVARPVDRRLDDLLMERLAGHELAGIDPDVLDVACVAPAVDGRLLAAVLPGRPTRNGLAQLRALSISEPLGSRVTLHPLVRSVLRARLRETDPDRHRSIVLRVAAHLRHRALTEDHLVVLEMADLVERADLRLGFDASTTHYADHPRPGDVDQVAAFTGAGDTAWFARFRRWCEEQPRQTITVRRATGELVAMAVICMAEEMPTWADDDIETGPILAHARAAGRLGETGLMHDTIIMEDPDDAVACAEVLRVGNAGAMAAGAVRNPRYIYVTATTWRDDDGTEPLGYQDVPELRRRDGERELTTIMTDFGPDGAVGQVYGLILAEQEAEPVAASGTTALALHRALRSFPDDAALAGLAIAPAVGTEAERAEAVRATVRRALDQAFTASTADQQLRTAIERAYLDPEGGHGVAQRELHMSRSSFYRHLQKARQQLVERSGATSS